MQQSLTMSQQNHRMQIEDEDDEDIDFDPNAELRRQEEEARRLLNSKPVNLLPLQR